MNNNVITEQISNGVLSITVPRSWVCRKEEPREISTKRIHKPVAIYGIRKEK